MKKWLKRCLDLLKHAENRVFLAASLFLLLFCVSELLILLNPHRFPSTVMLRVTLSILICALFYLGGCLHADRTGEKRIFMRLMWIFFAIYGYLILNFTLLDKGMGRADRLQYDRAYYMRWFVNFRPLQSIYQVYIKGFIRGYVPAYYLILNLLGNVCAFMPLSFFLPALFPLQKRWYVFLPTVTLSVCAVEALQFAFMVGSCDVDDLLLNVGGAMILYFVLRIPKIQKLTDKLTGKEA